MARDLSLPAPPQTCTEPPQNKAVYERMLELLADLQRQYAQKLDALAGQANLPEGEAPKTPRTPVRKDAKGAAVKAVEPAEAVAGDSPAGVGSSDGGGGATAAESPPVAAEEEAARPASGDSEGGGEAEEAGEEEQADAELEDAEEATAPTGSPASRAESTSRKQPEMVPSATPSEAAEAAPPGQAPKAQQKSGGAKKGGKKAAKKRDGIHCIKTVQFGGSSAVRCALTVKDEVWTADWSGIMTVRDKENLEKIKCMLPSDALVWSMILVEAQVPMVWVGRERAGIPIFHATSHELLCTLTGGHAGNVMAFAVADGPHGRTDLWSAGNDFSIRCWHVEPGNGRTTGTVPLRVTPSLQVRRGNVLHWHGNSVRCLLRIGPSLWSGGDDKAIVLWKCLDGSRTEAIENAHDGGVTNLVIAGRGVWSSGYDGRVKEWSIGGVSRECTREIVLNEPLRALCPVGQHVWMCGQSKKIAVYSSDMQQVDSLEGHSSFVSNLVLVDRMETRTLWSSSLGDRTLRVWRHILRGGNQNVAELAAANLMYEEQQWAFNEKLRKVEDNAGNTQAELEAATADFAQQLISLLSRAAQAEKARDAAEAERARAAEREGWARRAEAAAKAEAADLRTQLEAAVQAQQAAVEDARARMAEALAAEEARRKSEAERDTARREAAALSAQATELRGQVQDLDVKLGAALANAQEASARAEVLSAQLKEQGEDLQRVQAFLDEEQQRRKALEEQVQELRTEVSRLEHERDDANDREKQLMLRYAELDVFKLDIIARELKNIDRQVDVLRSDARTFQEAVKKFINGNDQLTSTKFTMNFVDVSAKLRGIIRDVIERCLSETQKLHVGAAIKDPFAAGVLKDGGRMAGYVPAGDAAEDSPGAHPRQQDEIRRDRRRGVPVAQ